MESSTVMMQASPCFYYSSSKKNNSMGFRKNNSCCFSGSRRKLELGFYDKAQMDYYSPSSDNKLVIKGKGKEEKMMKKREKLLKGLSKDLSALSQMMTMGFDLDSELGGDQVKHNTVAEAAELLLGRLVKLREEEKEMKRKKEEEKALSKTCNRQEDDMSSSSSSESSDSECEEEQVVNMDLLKRGESSANQPGVQDGETTSSSIGPPQSIEPLFQPHPLTSLPVVRPDISTDVVSNPNSSQPINCCKETTRACVDDRNKPAVGISGKKIEVCMGGKCKKSGSTTLLDEFQKAVGVDVPVTGCKCMGKCREGPNVRVVNNNNAQDSGRTLSTPLCIGVGLEDVSLIVANLLGENQKEVGLAIAP